MRFAAYLVRHDSSNRFSFDGRDDASGILGKLVLSSNSSVATADTLEELERKAREYLAKSRAIRFTWPTANIAYTKSFLTNDITRLWHGPTIKLR
jgi:hypothetical protein